MAEADSGSGPVSLFLVSNKLQARMYVLKEVIESQKLEVGKIGGEMRSLIKKKENEIIKELDSIWDEANARIDREKEEFQKRIGEIAKRDKDMKKNYDEMNQIFEQMDQKLPPLPQISGAVEMAKSELNISIPHLKLSWRDNVLKESIDRMCSVEQVFVEECTPSSSQSARTEIGKNEPIGEEEGEKKLDEWRSRNRILEQSIKTAFNENEILKGEVDQLKIQLQEARTKQANPQVVTELRVSLLQARKETEVLRTETKKRLKQSEQLEQERRMQDLEKLKQAQTEVESYRRASSGNREIGTNEARKKEEREIRLEMELDEWKNRNRILEQSMKTADNENKILKREIDHLTRTKQSNAQEVEELKLSLVQAKKEIEVLRTETKERLRQSEQLERERKNQDLEKFKQVQMEGENYKKAAYRYRVDRDKLKLEIEELALEKLQLVQTEFESCERAISGNRKIRPDTMFISGEYTKEFGDKMMDFSQSMDDQLFSQNLLPLGMKDDAAESKTSKAQNPLMLKDGAESETMEEKSHTIPRVIPKVFRQHSDAIGDEIERYKADVRTVFLNKTYSLTYNTSTIKTTNLSHLKNPDSHISKQVLVKIKGKLRLGNLNVVFSKMHVYLKRKEMMAGILLQEPVGISNGVFESTRHFNCPDNHAVFVLISDVYVPLI